MHFAIILVSLIGYLLQCENIWRTIAHQLSHYVKSYVLLVFRWVVQWVVSYVQYARPLYRVLLPTLGRVYLDHVLYYIRRINTNDMAVHLQDVIAEEGKLISISIVNAVIRTRQLFIAQVWELFFFLLSRTVLLNRVSAKFNSILAKSPFELLQFSQILLL